MRYCSVLNCNTDQMYKIRFHSFPKDEKLKKNVENLVLSVQNILKTNTFPPQHPHQQEQLIDNGEGES